jgi:hypothetical protein
VVVYDSYPTYCRKHKWGDCSAGNSCRKWDCISKTNQKKLEVWLKWKITYLESTLFKIQNKYQQKSKISI